MENMINYRHKRFPGMILMMVLCFFIPTLCAGADVSFHVSGRVYNIHVVEDDDGIEYESDPVPIPAAVIEIWDSESMILLGTGEGSMSGYYHVMYMAPDEPHTVFIRVLQIVDGDPLLLGEMHEMPDESPVLIDDRMYSLLIYIDSDNAIRFSDGPLTGATGQFMFVEVGNIDMDEIYDEEADPGYPNKWGLTKDNDSAFGRTLEIYGLFGLPTGPDIPYYYRIYYEASDTSDSGYITDDLYKKNYVIVGTNIVVNRINMYQGTVTTAVSGPIDNVYVCDEGLIWEDGYSPYWTEVGMRALWNTSGKTGKYTLSVEVWDHLGNPIMSSGSNDYDTLNLRLVNNPPECVIHTIEYLDGEIILPGLGGDECSPIVLLLNDGYALNDNIQFNVTAWQDEGFVGRYELQVRHGHDTIDGDVFDISYSITDPPDTQYGVDEVTFVTPGSITYIDCAYRFRLHIWPRITNGIDRHIYERQDNWYATVNVVE
jgi:hypothetical protein